MFDGNYRTRRTINLSKSTRRNRNHNNSSILQRSREERQKRLLEQRRLRAAKLIQKTFRGYFCRLELVHCLLNYGNTNATGSSGSSSGSSSGNGFVHVRGGLSSMERMGVLFMSSLIPFVKDVRSVLISFSRELLLHQTTTTNSNLEVRVLEERFILYRWILIQALTVLKHDGALLVKQGNHGRHRMKMKGNDVNVGKNDDAGLLMKLVSCIFASSSISTIAKMIRTDHGHGHGQGHSQNPKRAGISPLEKELISCLQIWLQFWNIIAIAQHTNEADADADADAKSVQGFVFVSDLMNISHRIISSISSSIVSQNNTNNNASVSVSVSSHNHNHNEWFSGCLAAVILGVDMSVSKQFYPRLHDHGQKMQTTVQMQTQTLASTSTSTSKDEFEWYISHYKALQTAMNANVNINANANANINANINATAEDASNSSERQFLSSIMTGREVIYLHNYLQILSRSRSHSHSQDTGKRDSLRLSVLQFMSQLFDPMRYTNTHTGTTGNSAGECTSTGTSSSTHLHSLVTLSGLAAKGMNLTHMLNGLSDAKAEIIDLTRDADEGEDDDDRVVVDDKDEDDVEMEDVSISQSHHHGARTGSVTTSRTNRPVSRKLQRQDLQTTIKLEKLYKEKLLDAQKDVMAWMKQHIHIHASASASGSASASNDNDDPDPVMNVLCDIAKGVGGGDLILDLVPVVFPKGGGQANQNENENENKNDLDAAKGYFCTLLSMALQNCTTVKARDSATSPLLSKLAFNPFVLEEIWGFARSRLQSQSISANDSMNGMDNHKHNQSKVQAYSAITSFCDLFAHHLLALDDDEFLLKFTDMNPDSKPSSRILAVDVIHVVKKLLYDVYWKRPVVEGDYIVPSSSSLENLDYDAVEKYHRARLLLSGTKLWNSIYARWSRLYRMKTFCDEESWWFPHLVTRDDDEEGAVDYRGNGAAEDDDLEDDDDSMSSTMQIDHNGNTEADNENETLASSFKDPKIARILSAIPQALPFDRRAKLFSSLVKADLIKTQDEEAATRQMLWNMAQGIEGAEFTGREKATIRRDELYNDSMEQLNKLGQRLKKKVQVTFISQTGNEEAGIDGGGLFKEFLDDLIKDAFDPETSHDGCGGPLFVESPLQTLAINTQLKPTASMLAHFQFLGRVLGKAVYESILVEPQFCLPFLNQLLGEHNTIDDLKNLDPEYYKHLSSLRNMTAEDIKSLDLTFELTAPFSDRKSPDETVELIPKGKSIRVTKENAIRYVHLVAHRRLNMWTAAQTNSFLRGFRDLIPASWVRLFSPYELQKVISGDDTIKGFDVKSLKNVMVYGGGYHPSQPIMIWFWEVIEELTPIEKNKFLKFVTSCSRQPLLGFRALSPAPCVHQVRLEENDGQSAKDLRLPTSATCMNLLKLPNYKSKEILRAKLLYAIDSGAGFELS